MISHVNVFLQKYMVDRYTTIRLITIVSPGATWRLVSALLGRHNLWCTPIQVAMITHLLMWCYNFYPVEIFSFRKGILFMGVVEMQVDLFLTRCAPDTPGSKAYPYQHIPRWLKLIS